METQQRPKYTTSSVTLPVTIMEKRVSDSEDPNSDAQNRQCQFPVLRDDPEKLVMFMAATLNFLRRAVFPFEENKMHTMSSILDEYLSIWSEICVDKSDVLRTQLDCLYMLDMNLMVAFVAMQERKSQIRMELDGYEDSDEETPEIREVYCPNCDESSEEDEIHPNTGTEYLACGTTTNPWKNGPAVGNEDSTYATTTYSASEMATPKVPADDCSCLCVTCCASRGLDSDDDSYIYPSSDSESEDDIPCQYK
ncbi:uncharacterized protein EAE97_001257 [Botrytis byssoidea]|uniref:Uncharacterized protein n=1 Tax=Botrytis byssoidea TaxID=139641 RepID=A0A9P5M3T0_9HELO|nr:uncharacterized protein EAE97_001257 [Botrytis byssoidea]KAF7953858.1 hypothetical protein EAE97_001257 [Botrytis byssoidea]